MIAKLEFKILEHLFENVVGEMAQGELLPPKCEDLNSNLYHPPRSQAQCYNLSKESSPGGARGFLGLSV